MTFGPPQHHQPLQPQQPQQPPRGQGLNPLVVVLVVLVGVAVVLVGTVVALLMNSGGGGETAAPETSQESTEQAAEETSPETTPETTEETSPETTEASSSSETSTETVPDVELGAPDADFVSRLPADLQGHVYCEDGHMGFIPNETMTEFETQFCITDEVEPQIAYMYLIDDTAIVDEYFDSAMLAEEVQVSVEPPAGQRVRAVDANGEFFLVVVGFEDGTGIQYSIYPDGSPLDELIDETGILGGGGESELV